ARRCLSASPELVPQRRREGAARSARSETGQRAGPRTEQPARRAALEPRSPRDRAGAATGDSRVSFVVLPRGVRPSPHLLRSLAGGGAGVATDGDLDRGSRLAGASALDAGRGASGGCRAA